MAAPVLQLPLRLVAGRFATLPQSSRDEVVQSVTLLLRTILSTRIEVRGYGIDDPTFTVRPDLPQIRRAIERWEPRAAATVTDGGIDLPDDAIRSIIVATGGR